MKKKIKIFYIEINITLIINEFVIRERESAEREALNLWTLLFCEKITISSIMNRSRKFIAGSIGGPVRPSA
jgi:hypothetical protein